MYVCIYIYIYHDRKTGVLSAYTYAAHLSILSWLFGSDRRVRRPT